MQLLWAGANSSFSFQFSCKRRKNNKVKSKDADRVRGRNNGSNRRKEGGRGSCRNQKNGMREDRMVAAVCKLRWWGLCYPLFWFSYFISDINSVRKKISEILISHKSPTSFPRHNPCNSWHVGGWPSKITLRCHKSSTLDDCLLCWTRYSQSTKTP